MKISLEISGAEGTEALEDLLKRLLESPAASEINIRVERPARPARAATRYGIGKQVYIQGL